MRTCLLSLLVLATLIAAKIPAAVDPEQMWAWQEAGEAWTAAEVAAAEAALAGDASDDLATRIRVLGAYGSDAYMNEAHRAAAVPHLLWLAEHHPTLALLGWAEVTYMLSEGADPQRLDRLIARLQASADGHPERARILANIGRLAGRQRPPLAEAALQEAIELDPTLAGALSDLGDLRYAAMQELPPGDARRDAAAKAAGYFNRATAIDAGSEDAFYRNTDAIWALYEAGDHDGAATAATAHLTEAEGFRDDWNYGNAIYAAHCVLGACAYSAGDLDAAAKAVLAASETPGSPQLDTFGPDFSLAAALLTAGRTEDVRSFLVGITNFWEMHDGRCEAWLATIAAGQRPRLGPCRFALAAPTD